MSWNSIKYQYAKIRDIILPVLWDEYRVIFFAPSPILVVELRTEQIFFLIHLDITQSCLIEIKTGLKNLHVWKDENNPVYSIFKTDMCIMLSQFKQEYNSFNINSLD